MGIKDTLKDIGNVAVAVGEIALEPVISVAHSVALGTVAVGAVVVDKGAEVVCNGAKEVEKIVLSKADELNNQREKINRYKERYEELNDQELKEKIQNEKDILRKRAMIEILKERGY